MARKPDEPLTMLGGRKKLSPMELEFMRYIWEHPDGISSEENELLKIAQILCLKHGISLTKNPSYLPERRTVQMKVENTISPDNLRQAEEEFLERTGCACTFTPMPHDVSNTN